MREMKLLSDIMNRTDWLGTNRIVPLSGVGRVLAEKSVVFPIIYLGVIGSTYGAKIIFGTMVQIVLAPIPCLAT
jgi:hypothetical protein